MLYIWLALCIVKMCVIAIIARLLCTCTAMHTARWQLINNTYNLPLPTLTLWPVWRNSKAFICDPKGCEFESRPAHFQVTSLGKLLNCMCLCHQAV